MASRKRMPAQLHIMASVIAVALLGTTAATVTAQVLPKPTEQNSAAEEGDSQVAAKESPHPSLADLIQKMAEYERAYLRFRMKTMLTFRMSEGLTPEERIRYPWADGRKHQRLMEYAQGGDRIWFRKEQHITDGQPANHHSESYSDGTRLVQVSLSDPPLGRPPVVHIDHNTERIGRRDWVFPLLGIFPLPGHSEENLFSQTFKDRRSELRLDWDDGDARLTFEFGPENFQSRYALWLSHAHDWHPRKLQRYFPSNAKQFFEAWAVTKFAREGEQWRVADGMTFYRDMRDTGSPDAKVMYSVDFKVLEAEWGKELPAETFRYEIPEGANVRDRQQPEAVKPSVTATREIAVRVFDIDNKPVEGATVRLSGTRDPRELDRVTSNDQGVARSSKAPEDNVALRVEAAGFRPATWVLGRGTNELPVILTPRTRGVTVDEKGTPIPTVWITSEGLSFRADGLPNVPHGGFAGDDRPDWSDRQGQFELKKSLTLRSLDQPVPLMATDEQGENIAITFLPPPELGKEQKLVLQPVCRVRADFLLAGMIERMVVSATVATDRGQQIGGVQAKTELTSDGLQAEFNLRLPQGKYVLQGRRSSQYSSFILPFAVPADQKELDLGVTTVPPSGTVALIGKPAPAIDVRWRLDEESSLDKYRGRVVVLDFWGTWCIPCIQDMPRLMDIAEQFKDRPVDWLTVHTPTGDSFAEFDRQVADIRHRSWNGRELPFKTVIDLPASDDGKTGKTASRYGVVLWPTIIVIDQSGRVVGSVPKDKLAETLSKLLEDRGER